MTEDDIVSRPFKALLRGFHHPGVSWAGQVAPDLKGFISVFANTMYDTAKAERGLGGKSFAIVTESYLNFNSRIGYHFGIVDAFISEESNDNYISFQFKGGAAAIDRRERRARLVKQLLDDLGFKAQTKGDLVQGRLVKLSLLETEADPGTGRTAHRLLPPTRPGPVLRRRHGTLPSRLQNGRLQPLVPAAGGGRGLKTVFDFRPKAQKPGPR